VTADRFQPDVPARHARARLGRGVFFGSLAVAVLTLGVLLLSIVNDAVGLIALESRVDPAEISDRPLDSLSRAELQTAIEGHASGAVLRRLAHEAPLETRSREELLEIVYRDVLEDEILGTWGLWESLTRASIIRADVAQEHPRARFEMRLWVRLSFLLEPMSSRALRAGLRTAILGSLWMGLMTIVIAFPLGVSAAVYLEEYAERSWLQRVIQTNIDNLAGVPSIIYGMLGLAIFVRTLSPLTSGAILGSDSDSGRTLLSASLTMALLVLPVIIINAQEAIRAVPNSLRQASYGLGATRWQTVWGHVLPASRPGILTGTILGVSRLLGETAPLIVVGAATYIVNDPSGPFSRFTAIPIQIYSWTTRPQGEFHHLAAAAILVLLALLLTLNSAAIVLRNRASRQEG
jgi:phosphate transport system permease protein